MPVAPSCRGGLPLVVSVLLLVVCLVVAQPSRIETAAQQAGTGSALIPIDVRLRSDSTGTDDGSLAVRVHAPQPGNERYPEGAPVIIWILGGFEVKGINHGLPAEADDVICITFIFPGGHDPWSGLSSDGIYDYRGEACAGALRDVVLFAAGELTDTEGRTIDQLVSVPVLHDNIGVIGESNGGNLPVTAAALYGAQLEGHLGYVIQWETPVSSQIATRDLGRIWLRPSNQQGAYWNPRYSAFGSEILPIDYSDLIYDPASVEYPVVHDGNGDGVYTTVSHPEHGAQVPDLDGNSRTDLDEDFPVDTYPMDETRLTYSRPVTHALERYDVFGDAWPEAVASAIESDAYWDLRESVVLYEDALREMPDLSAMVLCGLHDHVQEAPGKPHIRQAFEGWDSRGAWVKINPSPSYLAEVAPQMSGVPFPDLAANTPPLDWTSTRDYAVPPSVPKPLYELAGIYQMADRMHARSEANETDATEEAPSVGSVAIEDTDDRVGGWITFVQSEGIGRIAVHVQAPETPRFHDGAPVVVNVSGFFTGSSGFDYELDPDALGCVYITYLWPGKRDARTGVASEGAYDYGGADCLAALRDVVRYATGEIDDAAGQSLQQLIDQPVRLDVAGIYAFSHSGIAATNVMALHGSTFPGIRFFVGRENPTIDTHYPLEPGYWDDETGRAVHNPFYDPAGYTPTSTAIDYSTVYWSYEHERPAFRALDAGQPDFVCSTKHPRMWGKDYWSTDLLQALLDNGSLTTENWPENLATPEEAAMYWPQRMTVFNYRYLPEQLPNLRVMLLFAADDHVQTAIDKPHIHQAYDGFHDVADLWCRLNPDRAYVEALLGEGVGAAIPDNPANTEPSTWAASRSWGYRTPPRSLNTLVPLAGVAEMLDRTAYDVWEANLEDVLSDPTVSQDARGHAVTVRFPDGTEITASPLAARQEALEGRDYGLYMDPAWAPSWEADLIHWPDFGIPTDPPTAAKQIVTAFERAQAGEGVEIGCIGGIGRTGTVLACMAILGGISASDAVEWVRANYKPDAVETDEQEGWVLWFGRWLDRSG